MIPHKAITVSKYESKLDYTNKIFTCIQRSNNLILYKHWTEWNELEKVKYDFHFKTTTVSKFELVTMNHESPQLYVLLKLATSLDCHTAIVTRVEKNIVFKILMNEQTIVKIWVFHQRNSKLNVIEQFEFQKYSK